MMLKEETEEEKGAVYCSNSRRIPERGCVLGRDVPVGKGELSDGGESPGASGKHLFSL